MRPTPSQFGYITFYEEKQWECHAKSSYDAYEKAVAHFKPTKSKRWMISVMLAEKDGQPVVHSTASI